MSTNTSEKIPAPLVEAIKSGRVVLFLGAGASMEANSTDGKKPPSAKHLAKDLSECFLGKDLSAFGLMQVAEMAARARGQNVVFERIRSLLRSYSPSSAHRLIPTFRWHTIATTNYDMLVEDAYGATENPIQNILPFVKDSEPIETKKSETLKPVVYLKLHGCVEHAHDKEIPLILDHSHYESYRENRERLFDRLTDVAHELPFLFVGYSLNDPHIRNIIYRLDRLQSRPEFYVVSPNIPIEISQHWQSQRVVVIDETFGSFMEALDEALPNPWRQMYQPQPTTELSIQKHFRTPSEISETLSENFSADFVHVHPSMPTEEQAPRNFYRGYDRGFAAIASNFDARRRVSNDLILQLIDDVEIRGVKFYLVRGAAGTGKTVVLKRIAWEIAKEFSAPVLWFLETGRLRSQTVLELYDLIGERIYLVIDRAIEHFTEIEEIMNIAFTHGIDISIISAERDATWNVYNDNFDSRWDTHPFSIGQLVQTEIEELIECLKNHSALGVLTSLSLEEQILAFEEADRHLLVALHEVTHGKPFEEIVMDEYLSLSPQKAQQLYLDVCTLNQFGASVRAGLIKRISGIPFTEFQEKFFLPLQEVVLTQNNHYSGDYDYKSRHPRIASLVFQQAFPDDEERVSQIERIVSHMDEGYSADQHAITELTKARNLTKLLTDVNQGRRVYDCMQALLGNRWYIHHQKANFELRHDQGSLEDAEKEAQRSLDLEPGRASVLHTLAEISRRRAQQESDGLRKDIFRQQARQRLGKIKSDYSGFAESSRCNLRLDEMHETLSIINSEDDDNVKEFAEKSRLARQDLDKAIERHPTNPEILSLEAKYFRILKDDNRALVALERAWNQNPRGPGVALQLARLYQDNNNLEKTKNILEEALDRHQLDPSVNFAMARQIIREGTNFARAAYYFGRSYHSSDRNYVARYEHAQYLLLIGDGDRSTEVFDEVNQIAPPDYHPRSGVKTSTISTLIGRVNGRVLTREESYAFLKLQIYPRNIYTNISNSDVEQWSKLRYQANVNFEVGFNRCGPVGIDVRTG